ncbi:MAG: hypothetical protein HRU46_02975 [Verrucomicrobiales bacterium]|nr:hypothetical protein [Verrucomicrobiales bacterium]
MSHRFLSLLLPTVLPVFAAPLHADDWHQDDETFDPEVPWVVIDNASRLGDPTPFFKDGNGTRSFTVIEAKADGNGGATVNFSLIVPFVPGESAVPEGGALFMNIEQTERLIGMLKDAIAAPNDAREVGKVFEDDYYQQYTIVVEPNEKGPLVLKHEMNDTNAHFRFDISPAKKLIDTLEHRLEEAKQIVKGEN